jgi:AraC family transcriptional regulator
MSDSLARQPDRPLDRDSEQTHASLSHCCTQRVQAGSGSCPLRSGLGRLMAALGDVLDGDPGTPNVLGNRLREIRERFRAVSCVIDVRPAESHGPAGIIRSGLAPKHIRSVAAFIDVHLNTKIKVADLSRLTGQSSSHFSRAFRQSFGEPPHKYVVRRRVERGQSLMLSTEYSLARIADECGFADQSHLTRVFRTIVGENPYAWRRARAGA